MTLLHFDGFELGDAQLRYGLASSVTTTNTRYGVGLALNGQYSFFQAIPASAEVYAGASVMCPNLDGLERIYSTFSAAGTAHLTWTLRSTGMVARLGNNTGTALATWSSSLYPGAHYYVEAYGKIADSGGRFVVKLDGTTVIDFTGDTKNAGTTTTIDSVSLTAAGTPSIFDDWYICDGVDATATQGAPNNTFLGDVRVITLAPTGAGNTTGMTPSTGSNWAAVDEQPFSATDYVQGAAGTKDTYATADLPATANTVIAVQGALVARKTDAGTVSARPVIRVSGTDYTGTSVSMGASDAAVRTMWTKNPATGALWTPAQVNGAEVGVEAV